MDVNMLSICKALESLGLQVVERANVGFRPLPLLENLLFYIKHGYFCVDKWKLIIYSQSQGENYR